MGSKFNTLVMCCGKSVYQGVKYPSPVKGMTYDERMLILAETKAFKELEEKGYEVTVTPMK